MCQYIIRRLLAVVPVVIGVSFLVFFILHLTPGNPALLIAGADAPPEVIAAIEQELGLDQPVHSQFFRWFSRLLQLDMGKSLRSRLQVTEEIGRAFPVTFQLTLVAIAFSVLVSVPLGVVSAVRRDTWLDSLSMFAALIGISIPVFAVGLIAMWIFGYGLRWFPISGFQPLWEPGGWKTFVLPTVTVSTATIATVARLTRSSMLEVLGMDYIRTGRAKGLPERAIIYRHVLRNALLPVLTVVGLQFGYLLGGAVVTETIFALPGLGRLSVQAIQTRDFPLVQGVVFVIAVTFVLVNVLVDVLYSFIDPRIEYQ